MSRSNTSTRAPDPRPSSSAILIDAIRWAGAQGLPVIASADPGVVCTSTALNRWEVDPTAIGISPLGAAVLRAQPPTADLDTACFLAVGESIRWVEGYTVGVAGLNARPAWGTQPAGPMLVAGYLVGLDHYTAATSRITCRHHPGVRYPRNGACPTCAAEDAGPTKPDTRSEAERAADSDPNITPVGGG